MPRTAVTTPIRNLAQPYPLVNKLTDGDMEAAGVDAWTAYGGSTLTKETASPHSGTRCLRCAGTAVNAGARQTKLVSGLRYLVTGWARGDGTVSPRVLVGGVNIDWLGTSSTSWQPFSLNVVANGVHLYLLQSEAVAGYVEFDDVQVIDLTATPTRQLAQPFTIANKLVDGDMEAAGVAAWTVSHLATLTKDSSVKNSGTQSLKVAYNGSGDPAAFQVVFTIGTRYRVRGVARGNGVVEPKIYSGSALWTGAATETWQEFDIVLTATTTPLYLMLNNGGAGDAVWFDDVEIIDLSATPMRLPATGRTNV